MIRLIVVFKSVLLCLVFIISLRFIDTHIEFLKPITIPTFRV